MRLDFEKALSLVLAHTIVCETRWSLSPNGIVDDAQCNEGSPPDPRETTQQALTAYTQNLPRLLQTAGPALNQFMQTVSPAQQSLQAQLFSQYAPILNQIGQQMNTSNAQSQSASDASILNGTGKQVVGGATALQQTLDPQFYGLRDQIAGGVSKLLNGLGNPNALSGSEEAQIERSLNRGNYNNGNAFNGNPLTTIQNAMTFGQGLQQRQGFNMGIQQAAGSIAPQLKSGMDAFQMTTGKPSASQFGGNQITGANTQSGDGLANNMLSGVMNIGNTYSQLSQQQKQNNSIQGVMSSLPNV